MKKIVLCIPAVAVVAVVVSGVARLKGRSAGGLTFEDVIDANVEILQ